MINKIRDKVIEFYKSLSKKKKILLFGGIAAAIILIAVVIVLATKVEYVQIAGGLEPQEAKMVTDKLDAAGIPWRDEAATAIFVPKGDVSKARMELASAVNAGKITWENVFTSDSLTMTSTTRDQMIVRAQAGEIQKSIETIQGVKSANVILSLPKESNYFMSNKPEAKASIILNINSNFNLSDEIVDGIVNLVSSSALDLKVENVTILDQTGRQLNNNSTLDEFNAGNQHDMKVQYETKVSEDLKRFLTTIYGVGNIDVMASASLDFDSEVETHKIYSPPVEGETTGIIRSLTRIKENVSSEGAVGAPGTDSNTGEATSVTEDEMQGSYVKASETLNYEINESFKEIKKAQGQIKNLTIAVLVNTKVLENNTITDQHVFELKKLISNSVNTPVESISVVAKEFADPMAQYDIYTGAETDGTLFGIGIIIALAAVVIIAIAVIVIMLRKKKKAEEAAAAAAALAEMEEAEHAEEDYDEIGAKDEKGSPKYHIERFIDKNPEAAVTLLRAWLNDV